MSFDWREYLVVANRLIIPLSADPDIKEGCQRAAISRAYYAAHHVAREKLPPQGQSNCPRDGKAHDFVLDWYRRAGGRESEIVSDDLESLRTWRGKADYEKEWLGAGKHVYPALKRAAAVLRRLDGP